MKHISESDLQHIFNNTGSLWQELAGKSILITGGTGFFGKWLTKSIIYANQQLLLDVKLYILSRNPEEFLSAYPEFRTDCITYLTGDICDFVFPDVPLHYIIHAATEASSHLNVTQPQHMFDTILNGTKQVLELAVKKNIESLLLTSSGAVYGKQPEYITHIAEDANVAPDVFSADAAYGEGKRVAELLCSFYYNKYGINTKIARCFAFTGPYLPLNAHFAVGNFMNDVLQGNQIQINGDGSPYRSYLYASDLVIWLFTILFKGKPCRPYNVGSDKEVNILSLAEMIHNLVDDRNAIDVKEKITTNSKPKRYVPSIQRAQNELGLKVLIDIKTALKKTYDFYSHMN
jgi:nucleoside-diphosphate-sugar epimerase